MEKFIIEGGHALSGHIAVNGAKNHVLKMIPACFLASEPTTITNVPALEDVARMLDIVENIGGTVNRISTREIQIIPPQKFSGQMPRELVKKMRASIVFAGPLLARYGQVSIAHPGGDNIGKRPIDFFIEGFALFGATVEKEGDTYHFSAPNGLVGATCLFPTMSVMGTETLMMTAVLAKGRTVLKNAACEPEIVALAEYLNSVGAQITGAGTHTINIQGVAELRGGTAHIIPDRIEAGSFIILAAATNSDVTIDGCHPEHLEIPLHILADMGVPLTIHSNAVEVHQRKQKLKPFHLITHEYPGFATDLQPPMTVLLTQAEGESSVRETIYEGRLFYTEVLNTMGAQISLLDLYRVTVNGPTPFIGKEVTSPDIRAGIAMVIAGLLAKGETTVNNIYHIDRGYERIEERLQHIGAHIQRITE
ncbi:MAG: UDP-N-acetylglucosamine 1-carboxyvinyltransferase [Candidatus Kerfeldbacteria bacterium]|nr:UDP-N-acetylglucosamine 1-carboxyvinyltransferase [Candidatus Kerfeldbacteria bacterium]